MTETATYLLSIDYPDELTAGARSAVTTCLRIDSAEKVTLITDRVTEPIAAALGRQLAERGCPWNVFVLEDLAPRPLIDMPAAVLADMETSQVSIFAVQVQTNELRSRMQMTDIVNRRHMRHAHMVNITPEIMCQGMRADFNLVDRLSQKVLERVRKATRIRATTAAGTDITAEMNPGYKWFKNHFCGEVGQPARRRVLYVAGRRERQVCGGRRGGRLALRPLWAAGGNASDHRDCGQSHCALLEREQAA